MALRFRVCRVDELPPGEIRGFLLPGVARPVLLVNLGDRIVAAASTCPHEDVSLLDGELDRESIVCPGHAYAFDLRTGRCQHDPKLRLPVHRVEILGDDVFVDLAAPPR